jgi:hypothetical protein
MGYINLHCDFQHAGQKVKCNLCSTVSDVPSEHFGPIDEFGKRLDKHTQPQFYNGTFEYKLAPNYLDTVPVKPRYVFCIDISSTSIMNGLFYCAVQTIKQCLDYF